MTGMVSITPTEETVQWLLDVIERTRCTCTLGVYGKTCERCRTLREYGRLA